MILRRLGNKQKLAQKIQQHFPPHKIYIEPFFGAGGMFFNKPKAKYNYLNDLDDNVFNCFMVLMNHKDELIRYIEKIPYHKTFFNYCKTAIPKNDIEKAVYFLVLSNFGYMGKQYTLRFAASNSKQHLIDNIYNTYDYLADNSNQFNNDDFKRFLKSFSFKDNKEKDSTLIYADPPYIDTCDNYSNSFTNQDSIDLFYCLQETGCKFAYSEFDNEFIINQARERNLNVIYIGERQNLKNRRTEILITNYQNLQGKLF